jgi:predicted esterase
VSHHIKVSRTARYETLGRADGALRELWFVLHGYGQLATSFVEKFKPLDDGTRLIVAPEALNRFYLSGVETAPAAERAVGATWMTREDRLSEIEDYIAYLDAVHARVRNELRGRAPEPRLVVLGFSQGTATAVRWVSQGKLRPSDLVLWGGFAPPETQWPPRGGSLAAPRLQVVVGTGDRFVSEDRLAQEEARLREGGVPYRLVRYDGGHGINAVTLRDLARSIAADA